MFTLIATSLSLIKIPTGFLLAINMIKPKKATKDPVLVLQMFLGCLPDNFTHQISRL